MFLPQQKHVVFVLLRNGDNYSVPNAFQPMTETKHHSFFDSFNASLMVPGAVWY